MGRDGRPGNAGPEEDRIFTPPQPQFSKLTVWRTQKVQAVAVARIVDIPDAGSKILITYNGRLR